MELRSRLLPQAKVATLYMLSIVIPEHAEHTDASASVGYVTSQIVPPIIQYASAVGGYIAKAKIPSIFWLFFRLDCKHGCLPIVHVPDWMQ